MSQDDKKDNMVQPKPMQPSESHKQSGIESCAVPLKGLDSFGSSIPGGMYEHRAMKHPQSSGKSPCGPTQSSCGTMTKMYSDAKSMNIAKMVPTKRGGVGSFSASAIARLEREKKRSDQAEAVKKASNGAKEGEQIMVAPIVDKLGSKAAEESKDIVETEEKMKKAAGEGHSCADPMERGLQEDSVVYAKEPESMFQSLRKGLESGANAVVDTTSEIGKDAVDSAANLVRADENVAEQVDKDVKQMEEQAASEQKEMKDAGKAPEAEEHSLWGLPFWALALIGAALLFLVGGLIIYIWRRLTAKAEKPSAAGAAGAAAQQMMANVGEKASEGKSLVGKAVDRAGNIVGSVLQSGKDLITGGGDAVKNVGSAAIDGLEKTGTAVLDVGEAALDTVSNTASAVLEGDLAGAGSAAIGGVANVAEKTIGVGSAAVDTVKDTASATVQGAASAANTVAQGGFNVVKDTVGIADDIATAGADTISSIVGTAADVTEPAASALSDVVSPVADTASTAASLMDSVASVADDAVSTVSTAAASVVPNDNDAEESADASAAAVAASVDATEDDSEEDDSIGTQDIDAAFAEETEQVADSVERLMSDMGSADEAESEDDSAAASDVARDATALASALGDN